MPRDNPRVAAPRNTRCDHKILLAQREELAAHPPGQVRPAQEAQQNGDCEVHLLRGPFLRQGRSESHPQRQRWYRPNKFNETLNGIIHTATEITRDATNDQTEEERDE